LEEVRWRGMEEEEEEEECGELEVGGGG